MKIIGLTGKARSGKDTTAKFLQSKLHNASLYALADPLKQAAATMFNISLSDFYDAERKEEINQFWGMSPREIAQKLGTECARDVFREDFWLKRCESQLLDDPDYFIITDVRFDNEAAWVRERGGFVVEIVRPSLNSGVVRDHVSEAGVSDDLIDLTIVNDKDLTHLENQVNHFIEHFLGKA